MRKKIFMSLFTIAVVGAMMTGGAIAYFFDVDTVSNNVFQAGIIDLEIGGASEVPITLDDMKPCDWDQKLIRVKKAINSNPGWVWMHIGNVVASQGIWSEAEADAEAESGVAYDIQNWIDFDLGIDTDEDGVVDEVIIHPDDHMKLGLLESVWIPIGWVDDPVDIYLSFHLQGDTPNVYQGDKCTFDLDFRMQDHNHQNPAPSGGIILENKDASYVPILGDGIWGICWYDAGSLNLRVYAQGLDANTYYQIGINSPEEAAWYPVSGGETMRVAMASALAGGVYDGTNPTSAVPPAGFNIYERGYYTAGASTLHAGAYVDGDTGSYNFTQSGSTGGALTDGSGHFDVNKTCDLPSGAYEFIKVLIKLDSSPWTVELMEKDTPMFFAIP